MSRDTPILGGINFGPSTEDEKARGRIPLGGLDFGQHCGVSINTIKFEVDSPPPTPEEQSRDELLRAVGTAAQGARMLSYGLADLYNWLLRQDENGKEVSKCSTP